MRPDEIASESLINRSRERDSNLKKGFKTAVTLGATVAGGTVIGKNLTSRILPFLSEYIPPELALKGISKVSPKLGDFLKKGLNSGLALKGGLDYIKNNLPAEKSQPTKENRSVIQQYSDELDAFIKNHIQQGRNVLEAGALAQLDPKFKKIISRIESDHKTPFSAILQSSYPEINQDEQTEQSFQQPQKNAGPGREALYNSIQNLTNILQNSTNIAGG